MNPDERRQTAIVTGGYGVIGTAIAVGLAEAGCRVVIVGRDERRARDTAARLSRETGGEIDAEIADLSRRADIDALAERWEGPLDILVNNAGATPRQRQETPEGIEVQFATNVLGYVWMTLAFEQVLAGSSPARVVNVASYWAGDLDIDDLEFERRRYDNDTAYRQSKQANRMLTVVFADRLREEGVTVNACHPGDTASKLARNLGFGGSQTPEECARTPLYLALSDDVADVTGGWFSNCARQEDRFASDRTRVEQLWDEVESYL